MFKDRMLSAIRKDTIKNLSPELKKYIAEIQEKLHPSTIKKVVVVEKVRNTEVPFYEPDVYAVGLVVNGFQITNIRLYQTITDLANSKNEIVVGIGEKIE